MPIYEYCCAECGERFEVFVRSPASDSRPVCPKCGGVEVKKAVSLFGVSGKGSEASPASCGSGST